MISNHIQFDFHKEIKDSNGQYLILKGILDQTPVTLVNIYAPPGSNKSFFKSLFDIIKEIEGVCKCGGDFNVILNQALNTTSKRRIHGSLPKFIKNTWEDIGFSDVWRELHPKQNDFTHYSATHKVYSRIDFFPNTKGKS